MSKENILVAAVEIGLSWCLNKDKMKGRVRERGKTRKERKEGRKERKLGRNNGPWRLSFFVLVLYKYDNAFTRDGWMDVRWDDECAGGTWYMVEYMDQGKAKVGTLFTKSKRKKRQNSTHVAT